jgi:hypothetical protein
MERYSLWDLGPISGLPEPNLNNANTVIAMNFSAFEWVRGFHRPIYSPGSASPVPFAISDNGLVVGNVESDNGIQSFSYSEAGIWTDLAPFVHSVQSSSAQSVNSRSVIVGCSDFGVPGLRRSGFSLFSGEW